MSEPGPASPASPPAPASPPPDPAAVLASGVAPASDGGTPPRGYDAAQGPDRVAPGDRPMVQPRSELEIRWRQARNPPPPVVRAVLANIAVAAVGGVLLLLVDWLAGRGTLPAEWASLAPFVYVAVVVVSGSLLTYLWVELPTGRAGERRRSGWSAVLGFFASIPIVYLALVLIFQVIRPLLG